MSQRNKLYLHTLLLYKYYTVILAWDLRSALAEDIKKRRVVNTKLAFRDNLSVPTSTLGSPELLGP